ncbi:Nuclear protein STH1/NPS1 [Rhodotorula toruloides]|uniref:BY PROTMAP: gi/472585019/gb/EMS22585.1/ ATP-dependent helicase STH1/SNF2 [Rhodosporidium toruloides NP11] gi/647403338/emb/CDR49466.1/ RHTO0S27e00276g1_1 [Rhodosporidium toruloides] n=1 Tax=Rhodotorula toruloides TaxID=5286 RepID=A0A0K3CFD9_RHOTO|nr:Nuclear protein STH1/NPS1 [Rhodotorula toruloides]PRQ74145.1 SNF2 family N-terminal domain-domain containing protein [Rhodotorula toruloides]
MAAVQPAGKQGPSLSPDKLRQVIARIQQLKGEGLTVETSTELANLTKIILALSQRQRAQSNGVSANGTTTPSASTPAADAPASSATTDGPIPPVSPSTVPFTPEQVAALRCQVVAFRLLARNQPIPPALQAALAQPSKALEYADKLEDGADKMTGDELNPESLAAEREKALAAEPPVEEVEDPDSLVYPYNAFLTPQEILRSFHGVSGRRTLLIPNLLPAGLDPQSIIDERNRFIAARVQQRRAELEQLPSNLSQSDLSQLGLASDNGESLASQKIRALIELKSLNLLERQRALREQVVQGIKPACSLALPLDRSLFRRARKPTLRDATAIEGIERRQKQERERRAKQKHLDHLAEITEHGRNLVAAHRGHDGKFQKLGKALLKFHVDAEREEQKRVEKVSKERLKALRADDEEGYLKLIDTAKDTRITHLLRQTDSFLDSLAAAVSAQQSEARAEVEDAGGDAVPQQTGGEDERVDESRFGASAVFQDDVAKEKVDYYNVAHRVKETITKQPSILIGGELKPYQIKGLEWMVSLYNNHVNGILADEMGLGKTIQTLSLITYLIETKKQPGPYLVIVPLSTMPNWISEFEKWAPSVKVVSYKGTPAQRKQAQHEIRTGNFQVLLTTYEYIIKDRPLLAKTKWLHMIIDEGHRMKNTQSKLSLTLTQYYSSRYRLILTGTPLQNNLPELWALLNFVLPKIFGSVKSFDEWFNAPFANTGGQDKIELNEEESLLVIRRLHKVLRPFLLRRLKKDVESDLPDKVERVIKCKMSSLQLKLTKQIKEHGMIFTEGPGENKKQSGIRGLQNQIMQLRKICNHPFVFEGVERTINPTGLNDATLYRVAGKFELLDRILPKLFATGHRVLMFFQMTTVMTVFEDYLNFRRIEHLRLDGMTKHEDRATLLKLFNDPNSKYPIFILSTRAGGLGLNLQTADTVIIFDSDWNPHQDLQAQDRAHRIGQKKEVRILRLVTERSVEEHVMAGAARKIEMDKKIIQAGRYDNKSTAEERDAFLRALLEADDGEPEEDDDADEADMLNEAIARTEEERAIFAQMDRDRRAAEEAAWAAAGNTGKLPERLIQEWELPEVYRMDHPKAVVESDVRPDGSRRNRTQVTYDDGMSEEQWLQALEDEDDDSSKKRGKRRAAQGTPKYSFGEDGGASESDGDEPRNRLKRGRVSGTGTPSVNGDEGGSRAGGGKRRKVLSPYQEKLRQCFEELLTEVENLDNPTMGHQCAGLFNELPPKRDYPDYYLIITQPISLKEIKKKVNNGTYPDTDAFARDIHLMLNNAMTYNEEGSIVYEDARLLRETFNAVYAKLTFNGQPLDPLPMLERPTA